MSITLHAVVAEQERPAMLAAAERLSAALGEAAGTPMAVRCVFLPSLAAAAAASGAGIVVASLLPELDADEEPWPAVSQRLRAACQAVTRGEDRKVFVCTVLRHVPPGEQADRLRIRIRRLNLLAAELSNETGLHVIDIDRALADIGARVLRTDYRLAGERAVAAASSCIALTLLAVGLDEHASWEAQEAARKAIAADRPAWHDEAHDMILYGALAMGAGRRRQRVFPVVDSVQQHHVGWLLRCVLTRRISLSDALARLKFAIGQRGLRESLSILLAGFVSLLRGGGRASPTHR